MPLSPYAVTKLATEALRAGLRACFGFGALAFRFFNVFGPLQPAGHAYAAVVPAFVSAALAGRAGHRARRRRQTRDFTYVGLGVRGASPTPCASRGHQRPAGEPRLRRPVVAARAARRAGGDPRPPDRADATSSPAAGDVRDSQADQTNLRALFPDVEPVELERRAAPHGRLVPTGSRDVTGLTCDRAADLSAGAGAP